jgi:hypothetical protein
MREEVKRQLPILRGLLSHLPIVQIYQPGLEADDVIEVIATFCKHENVGIVTRDHDLYQLITDNHVIINPNTCREVELTESAKFYLWQKVICGDSSDNIPGVPGIGPVRSEKLLKEHGTLKNIIRHVRAEDSISSLNYQEFLKLVKRNLKLIKLGELVKDSQRSEILNYYKRARLNLKIDRELFLRDARDLEFESIYSRVKNYLYPFKALERQSKHVQHKTSEKHLVRKEDTECRHHARKIRNPIPASAKRVIRPWDKEGAATYVKRIRKIALDGLDSAGRQSNVNRAVQSDNGKARLVRVGLRNSGVPKNTEFRKRASMRRNNALSILQDLQTGSGLVWLQMQKGDVIQFVDDLVEAMKVEEFTMPRRYLEKLEAIYQDYSNEAPEWM